MKNTFCTLLLSAGILLQANAMDTPEEKLKTVVKQCFAEAGIDAAGTEDSSLMEILKHINGEACSEDTEKDKCAKAAESILNRMLDENMLDNSTAGVIPYIINYLNDDTRGVMAQKALTSFLNSSDQVFVSSIYRIYRTIQVGRLDTEAAQNAARAALERLLKVSELTAEQLSEGIMLLRILGKGTEKSIAQRLFDQILNAPVSEKPSIEFIRRALFISDCISPETISYFKDFIKKGFTAEPLPYRDREFCGEVIRLINESGCGRWYRNMWVVKDSDMEFVSSELIKYLLEDILPSCAKAYRENVFLILSEIVPPKMLPVFFETWCRIARRTLFHKFSSWSTADENGRLILDGNGTMALNMLLESQNGKFDLEEAGWLIDYVEYIEDFVNKIDFGDNKQSGIEELMINISDPERAEVVRACLTGNMQR